MLEDYRKIMVDRMGDKEQFTSDQVNSCMEKGNSKYYWQHYATLSSSLLPFHCFLPILSLAYITNLI